MDKYFMVSIKHINLEIIENLDFILLINLTA